MLTDSSFYFSVEQQERSRKTRKKYYKNSHQAGCVAQKQPAIWRGTETSRKIQIEIPNDQHGNYFVLRGRFQLRQKLHLASLQWLPKVPWVYRLQTLNRQVPVENRERVLFLHKRPILGLHFQEGVRIQGSLGACCKRPQPGHRERGPLVFLFLYNIVIYLFLLFVCICLIWKHCLFSMITNLLFQKEWIDSSKIITQVNICKRINDLSM